MTPDTINGFFEGGGSVLLWLNVRQLIRDRGVVKGVHFGPIIFFALWGVWNLYYYPALHQTWSTIGGIDVMLANIVWLSLYAWYNWGKT